MFFKFIKSIIFLKNFSYNHIIHISAFFLHDKNKYYNLFIWFPLFIFLYIICLKQLPISYLTSLKLVLVYIILFIYLLERFLFLVKIIHQKIFNSVSIFFKKITIAITMYFSKLFNYIYSCFSISTNFVFNYVIHISAFFLHDKNKYYNLFIWFPLFIFLYIICLKQLPISYPTSLKLVLVYIILFIYLLERFLFLVKIIHQKIFNSVSIFFKKITTAITMYFSKLFNYIYSCFSISTNFVFNFNYVIYILNIFLHDKNKYYILFIWLPLFIFLYVIWLEQLPISYLISPELFYIYSFLYIYIFERFLFLVKLIHQKIFNPVSIFFKKITTAITMYFSKLFNYIYFCFSISTNFVFNYVIYILNLFLHDKNKYYNLFIWLPLFIFLYAICLKQLPISYLTSTEFFFLYGFLFIYLLERFLLFISFWVDKIFENYIRIILYVTTTVYMILIFFLYYYNFLGFATLQPHDWSILGTTWSHLETFSNSHLFYYFCEIDYYADLNIDINIRNSNAGYFGKFAISRYIELLYVMFFFILFILSIWFATLFFYCHSQEQIQLKLFFKTLFYFFFYFFSLYIFIIVIYGFLYWNSLNEFYLFIYCVYTSLNILFYPFIWLNIIIMGILNLFLGIIYFLDTRIFNILFFLSGSDNAYQYALELTCNVILLKLLVRYFICFCFCLLLLLLFSSLLLFFFKWCCYWFLYVLYI